jgi:hypothetical protein
VCTIRTSDIARAASSEARVPTTAGAYFRIPSGIEASSRASQHQLILALAELRGLRQTPAIRTPSTSRACRPSDASRAIAPARGRRRSNRSSGCQARMQPASSRMLRSWPSGSMSARAACSWSATWADLESRRLCDTAVPAGSHRPSRSGITRRRSRQSMDQRLPAKHRWVSTEVAVLLRLASASSPARDTGTRSMSSWPGRAMAASPARPRLASRRIASHAATSSRRRGRDAPRGGKIGSAQPAPPASGAEE